MGSIGQEQTTTEQHEFKFDKLVSANGKPYEASKMNQIDDASASKVKSENRDSHGAPFSVAVEWPVDDDWHEPSSDFKNATGITWYKVGHSDSWIYDYYVQIWCFQDYDYYFTDNENDRYELNVFDTGADHIVRFNSSGPTIRMVTGS